MPKKRKIEIELTAKEEAFVHYEMEFRRNESIKRQTQILYYANQGADTIAELCWRTGHSFRACVHSKKVV